MVQRAREGPSSEAEIVPRVRGGCEWAACCASLSPFLSSGWEAGRGPSWAQLSQQVFVFLGDLSTPIRVSLIVVPDSSPRGFGRVRGFGQRVIQRFFPFDVISQCLRIRQTRLSASPADVTTRRSG